LFVCLFVCVCFGAASHWKLRWHTIHLEVGKYVPLHTLSLSRRLHLQQHSCEELPISQQCGLYRVSQYPNSKRSSVEKKAVPHIWMYLIFSIFRATDWVYSIQSNNCTLNNTHFHFTKCLLSVSASAWPSSGRSLTKE
jgi:hypothetical protein